MQHHKELRVHGVSGTPPRDMLYTDPLSLDPVSKLTRIWQHPDPDITPDRNQVPHSFDARAFHWGSLTTGSAITALWILLGPFAFANVAGWMTTRRKRLSYLGVRIAGMTMTALFVAQVGYLFLEIPLFVVSNSFAKPALMATTLLYLGVFVVGIVMWLSTQTHFGEGFSWATRLKLTFSPTLKHLLPPRYWKDELDLKHSQWEDPVGVSITNDAMWGEHAILHRIRRIHLALGVLAITYLVAFGLDSDWLVWATVIAAAVLFVTMWATTFHPTSAVFLRLTAWAPIASLSIFVIGYLMLAVGEVPTGAWPGYHLAVFYVTLLLGVGGLAALAAGWVALGAFVIGTLFGSSLGTGLGFIAEEMVGEHEPNLTASGAGWTAVAMFLLVVAIAFTAVILGLRGGIDLPKEGRATAILRRVTLKAHWVFWVAAAYGLVFGAVALRYGCRDGCSNANLDLPIRGGKVYLLVTIVIGILIVLAGIRLEAVKAGMAPIVVTVGGVALTLFAIGRLPNTSVGGVAVDFTDLVAIAKAFVIILPVGLILKSMLGGIRSGVSSRQVGVIWDVASMWPRWFHPLAPPAYGPTVVQDLTARLQAKDPEILAAHSQGSVIAAVTVHRLPEGVEAPALLTYGSPLGLLYAPLFPTVGIEEMVGELKIKLDGRWVNLWRATDPLGGEPIGLGDGDIEVTEGSGHSKYEPTDAFKAARLRLLRS